MMLQEAGDEEGLKDASKKLREYKDKYKDYSKEHGLGMHNDRTQVYGYDRSKSMKTVWSERKALIRTTPGVTSDFSVNYPAIDNKDYAKKYKGLTDSWLGDRRAVETARKCIKENDGTLFENVAILDSRNGKMICDFMRPGETGGEIIIPKASDNSFIVIHNHGNNDTFSFEDFALLNNCPQVKSIIAAGHNGIIYKMSVEKGKRLDLSNQNAYNDYYRDFNRRYTMENGNFDSIQYYCNALGWRFEYE
ncbi:MAG: hypothetical protein II936_08050 [Oscillospiraceae bacterium]|nr:hypothetical protein [Oscillospiraceae bacterium]